MKSLLLALTGAFLPIPSQAKTIACVGDSITYGSTSSDPSSTSYPPNLSRMLKGTMDVYNFGVSGATMKKDGDLPYWEQSAYDDALSSNPDYVVIQLGTNDAKTYQWDEDKYLEDYQVQCLKCSLYSCIHPSAHPSAHPFAFLSFLYITGDD